MPKSIALTLVFLATALLAPACRGAGPSPTEVRHVVDGVIPALMKRDGIPGMAVGLVVAGQPFVRAYGVASRITGKPVTGDTVFEVGSVSKTFTATLAALAQVDRRLSLTDSVSRHLPAFEGTPFGAVSLLELGTHTSGGLPLYVPDGIGSNAQLMQYLRKWKATCTPGTCRVYSNIGIGMLGVITARSEGKPFTDLVRQRVLAPLGMRDTWYEVPPGRMADYAQGYTTQDRPIRMAPGVLDNEAYGIKTSAADMVRFLEANLRPAGVDPRLRQAIDMTHAPHFKAGTLVQDLIWEQYAYPVELKTLLAGNSPRMLFDTVPAHPLPPSTSSRSAVWINKTGTTNGFAAYVAFIPAKGIGIVMLANKSYPIDDRVTAAYRILERLE